MGDFDLYSDLFEEKEEDKVESVHQIYKERIQCLTRNLTRVQGELDATKKNLDSLIKTCRIEIKRKDSRIADLKQQIDDLTFRRACKFGTEKDFKEIFDKVHGEKSDEKSDRLWKSEEKSEKNKVRLGNCSISSFVEGQSCQIKVTNKRKYEEMPTSSKKAKLDLNHGQNMAQSGQTDQGKNPRMSRNEGQYSSQRKTSNKENKGQGDINNSKGQSHGNTSRKGRTFDTNQSSGRKNRGQVNHSHKVNEDRNVDPRRKSEGSKSKSDERRSNSGERTDKRKSDSERKESERVKSSRNSYSSSLSRSDRSRGKSTRSNSRSSEKNERKRNDGNGYSNEKGEKNPTTLDGNMKKSDRRQLENPLLKSLKGPKTSKIVEKAAEEDLKRNSVLRTSFSGLVTSTPNNKDNNKTVPKNKPQLTSKAKGEAKDEDPDLMGDLDSTELTSLINAKKQIMEKLRAEEKKCLEVVQKSPLKLNFDISKNRAKESFSSSSDESSTGSKFNSPEGIASILKGQLVPGGYVSPKSGINSTATPKKRTPHSPTNPNPGNEKREVSLVDELGLYLSDSSQESDSPVKKKVRKFGFSKVQEDVKITYSDSNN